MRGWVFLLGVGLLLAGGVSAQFSFPSGDGNGSGGGSGGSTSLNVLSNDSPTPINGFTEFTGSCLFGNVIQQLVVCSSSPCDAVSNNHLCTSSYDLSLSKSCVVPAPVTQWGSWNGVAGSCCTVGGSCQPLAAGSLWVVGASPSSAIASSSLPSTWDFRSSLVVRRSPSEWVMAAFVSNRLRIYRTINGGVSWLSSFQVSSLVPSSTFPSGVSPSNTVVDQPSLSVGPDGSIHMVFAVRDTSSGKGTVYYSRCGAAANCGAVSSWQSATLIIDPLLDVDSVAGKWKYSFGNPKMVVDGESVHVVFDDTQPESPSRFDGIFYKTCLHSSGCDSFGDFLSDGPSPDILNSVSFGGYPRSPMMVQDADGGIHVSFLDEEGILYTNRSTPSSNPWPTPITVMSGHVLTPPSLSWGDDAILITSQSGSDIFAARCGAGACLDASSTPLFEAIDADLSSLGALSGLSSVVGSLSPSDGDKVAFLTTSVSKGIRQVVGLFWDESSSFSTGVRYLTSSLSDVKWMGFSSAGGHFLSSLGSTSMTDVSVISGTNAFVLSSNVLDFSNTSPVLSNLSPNAGMWQNMAGSSPSSTSFSKNVSFDLMDIDADDALYVSVFLASQQGGEDYPLLKWVNVKSASGEVLDECSSSSDPPFSNPSPCSLTVSLFNPLAGLAVPTGDYYLVVKAVDSAGGLDSISSASTIFVKASLSNLLVNSPSSGAVWYQKNPSQHIVNFLAEDATFAQSLGLHVIAKGSSGNDEDLGVVSVATFNSTASSCTKTAADYSCNTPLGFPSDLPEGKYGLLMYVKEDGILTANQLVPNITLDFQGPHATDSSPSGTVGSFPQTISFTLSDFSGVNAGVPMSVSVNGVELPNTPSCNPSSGVVSSVSCTVGFDVSILSLQGGSTSIEVEVSSTDGLGNEGETSFGFTVGQSVPTGNGGPGGGGGGGGGGGPSVIPSLDDLVTPTEDGGFVVNGTGIVIPGQIVDSFNRFSDRVILTASDLVEVTGPSANAIFLGLCTLAGIASDIVFRRVFAKLVGEMERQRQRVLRMVLGLVFFALPLGIGFQFGLAVGFIFAVLEVVLFIASAYLFKILQYYDTFGFKPIGPAQ